MGERVAEGTAACMRGARTQGGWRVAGGMAGGPQSAGGVVRCVRKSKMRERVSAVRVSKIMARKRGSRYNAFSWECMAGALGRIPRGPAMAACAHGESTDRAREEEWEELTRPEGGSPASLSKGMAVRWRRGKTYLDSIDCSDGFGDLADGDRTAALKSANDGVAGLEKQKYCVEECYDFEEARSVEIRILL